MSALTTHASPAAGPTAIASRIEACEAHDYRRASRIQPHGLLLAFDPATFTLARVSANADVVFSREPAELIGAAMADLVATEALDAIGTFVRDDRRAGRRVTVAVGPRGGTGLSCDGLLYHSDGLVCIEMDHPDARGVGGDVGILSSRFLEMVERIGRADVPSGALAEIVCAAIRDITGFDRVYFCRFDRHGHGHVQGESGTDKLPSLLDHHFPATDIPWAARGIYLSNPYRLIADVDARPIDILGGDGAPIDLALSTCREIAPTHLQYLRNMGVQASMSFSVVAEGRLAAIFGGHHATPRSLSLQCMRLCYHLVELFATRFEFLRLREERGFLAARVEALYSLSAGFRLADRDLGAFVAANHAAFRELMDADDLLCRFEGQIHAGHTLSARQAADLLDSLSLRLAASGDIICTDCLGASEPAFATLAPTVAGVLAIPLDLSCRNLLVWLRRETVVIERWSGDPHRPVAVGKEGAIGPRTSFKSYAREMKGTSVEWSSAVIDLARQSRQVFAQVLAAHYEFGMRAAAEQGHALKNEFIANVSHELRSPMHAIIGLSDILVGRNDSLPVDKRLRFAGAIRESGQRLLRLIDDLLDISKLEAGKMGFDFRHADIAATIDNAIEDVAPLAAAKNVAIVRAGQPPHTACLHDPARMRQVMINLLANAIKFSAPQSVITILLSVTEPGPGGASLMIEVADQGAGIPESELQSVFDSFVQSSRTKNGAGGTGLGLSISRQIVEAHRGSIWAANNRAGGASLHVRIPLAFASSRNASQ